MKKEEFAEIFGKTLAKQMDFYLWLRKEEGHIHSTSARYTKEIVKLFKREKNLNGFLAEKKLQEVFDILKKYIAKHKTRITLFAFKKYLSYLSEKYKDKSFLYALEENSKRLKKIPFYEKKDKIILSIEQTRDLINYIDASNCQKKEDLKLFVLLAYETGARVGALLKLTINKVIYDKEKYWVYLTEKRGKKRRFPTSKTASQLIGFKLEKLKKLKKDKPTQKLLDIAYQTVEKNLREIANKYLDIEGFTTHCLRRSRLSHLYDKTKDIKLCQRFAGHSSITTTSGYISEISESEMEKFVGDIYW